MEKSSKTRDKNSSRRDNDIPDYINTEINQYKNSNIISSLKHKLDISPKQKLSETQNHNRYSIHTGIYY